MRQGWHVYAYLAGGAYRQRARVFVTTLDFWILHTPCPTHPHTLPTTITTTSCLSFDLPEPYVTRALLVKLFGPELASEVAARFFMEGQGPGGYRFRPEYASEKVGRGPRRRGGHPWTHSNGASARSISHMPWRGLAGCCMVEPLHHLHLPDQHSWLTCPCSCIVYHPLLLLPLPRPCPDPCFAHLPPSPPFHPLSGPVGHAGPPQLTRLAGGGDCNHPQGPAHTTAEPAASQGP